jgi:hypothetical protein
MSGSRFGTTLIPSRLDRRALHTGKLQPSQDLIGISPLDFFRLPDIYAFADVIVDHPGFLQSIDNHAESITLFWFFIVTERSIGFRQPMHKDEVGFLPINSRLVLIIAG